MSGSSRPRRRRAAPASLAYTARAPRPAKPGPGRRDTLVGCGCALAIALSIIVPVVGSVLGGRELWRWVRDGFPGGGYAFAITVCGLVPVAFALGVRALTRVNWAADKARSVRMTALAVLSWAALMLLATPLVEMMGPSRKHQERHGGVAYEEYSWIWAVGLASTLAVSALIITLAVRHLIRTKASAPAAPDTTPTTATGTVTGTGAGSTSPPARSTRSTRSTRSARSAPPPHR